MNRLVRAVLVAAAAAACAVVVAYAWMLLDGHEGLNHVSGVWLTLARDTQEGVFYRALSQSGEYGGTRYFPLLFTAIAGVMRAGIAPVAAGQSVSIAGALLLGAGAVAFLRALDVRPADAFAGGVLSIAPYFVVQNAVAIRVEPLAMGLALCGAALVARRLATGQGTLTGAAAFLALAVAAKPTTAYAGIAGVLALACARRRSDALRLAFVFGVLCAAVVFGTNAASDGRALESFRACALAGGSFFGALDRGAFAINVSRMVDSRLLSAVLLVSLVAMVAAPRRLCSLPGLLTAGALASAFVALATLGTIVTNQGIEPYVAAVLFLVWVVGSGRRGGALPAAALSVLLAWVALQDVREIERLVSRRGEDNAAHEVALLAAVARCPDPVLAESPLVPVLAGRRAILLDPFAFRVAALNRPGLTADLERRLAAREFGCVILQYDPASTPGWYERVHLGPDTIAAIERNYTLRELAGGQRFYIPAD